MTIPNEKEAVVAAMHATMNTALEHHSNMPDAAATCVDAASQLSVMAGLPMDQLVARVQDSYRVILNSVAEGMEAQDG